MNGNGTRPLDDETDDDLDLLGPVEIALLSARDELRPLVERCDALEELRRRSLAIASERPDERTPITGDLLRAAALAEGEESLARLELTFDRLT